MNEKRIPYPLKDRWSYLKSETAILQKWLSLPPVPNQPLESTVWQMSVSRLSG